MRLILPLLFGLLGTGVLVWLGLWQLDRLEWKEGVLAEIEGKIVAAPVPLPETPDASRDRFQPVTVTGTVAGETLRVLGAWREGGSGYRVIAPLAVGERRILVDLGLVPLNASELDLPNGPIDIVGNLDWPDDVQAGTPDPDGTTWFGRDTVAMAEVLGTEPVMIVARTVVPEAGPRPLPVGTEGIPNNHLGYAIQWFGLAIVWLGMTVFLLWRMTRRTA
ncbi:MAG: SURF1 family protein [Pseudomonadota bacterium]